MEEDRFVEFYRRTARPLWGYLERISGNPTVADDLLQESYCRYLSTKLPPMNDAESKSYLFRIATNLLRDRWRSGKKLQETMEPQPEKPSAPCDIESKVDVRRALQQLQPRERQLLWLAYVEGASHVEIARMTGLAAGSIRTLLLRARRRVAELLREEPRAAREGK